MRDRWIAIVLRHNDLSDACKVTLLAFASMMTDSGAVSVPRATVAAIVGKHPSRITEHIGTAKKLRLLDQVGGGYRGRTAQYVAVIPTAKVTADRSPSPGQQSPLNSHLSNTDSPIRTPIGDLHAVTQRARVTKATTTQQRKDSA
jgi:hypothetical protein